MTSDILQYFHKDDSSVYVKDLPTSYLDFWKKSDFIPSLRKTCDVFKLKTWGVDASVYQLIPKIILDVDNEQEIQKILQLASLLKVSVTFRAAGTSLSGQAVTDSILIRLSPNLYWKNYTIDHQQQSIRLRPRIIGGQANKYLAPFGRKIGPDPASINAAQIGGIAANNASGMCCGVAFNSYKTLVSMRLVLSDGTLLDTGDEASIQLFEKSHAKLLSQLKQLSETVKSDEALAFRIAKKYKIKNTCGYSLNAFIDFDKPIDILQHLMIGSEGTLGFISEITLKTIEDYADKGSALIFFKNIYDASKAIEILKNCQVAAAELMDYRSLNSVKDKPGMPEILNSLPNDCAALLVETRANNNDELEDKINLIVKSLQNIETLAPIYFTTKPEEYQLYWNIRKGLFPAVGATRQKNTAVIIEDVAFDTAQLAQATIDLQKLFEKYAYDEAIIFGHALEGNLHFVITEDFSKQENIHRYQQFMDELCHLVVEKYDGSLKAEHSTGRNIAPYVELEWGGDAYKLMKSLKQIIDPLNILNPGVILNDDPNAHIKNLKKMPSVDSLVDQCIECGFCEPVCPSRALTLTPRQRIVALRELETLNSNPASRQTEIKSFEIALQYQAIQTCAGDGLCATACPVEIDTGQMMRQMRANQLTKVEHKIANTVVNNFSKILSLTRFSFASLPIFQKILSNKLMYKISLALHRISKQRLPLWHENMPSTVKSIAQNKNSLSMAKQAYHANEQSKSIQYDVIYFPSCVSRTLKNHSSQKDSKSLFEVIESLLDKANITYHYPNQLNNLCCGMPFNSKGAFEQANKSSSLLLEKLKEISKNGQIPILMDTSPCSYYFTQQAKEAGLKVYDLVEYLHDFVLPKLKIKPSKETINIHHTCSSQKMGLQNKMISLAKACSSDVFVAEDIACCGFAGDKGFNTPQLNASALRELAMQIPLSCDAGYSSSLTCEIGLSLHGKRPYRSIAYLLDERS